MSLEKELRTEVLKRNKAKFIHIVSESQQTSGVNLPGFIFAEQVYEEFRRKGMLDEYGFIISIEEYNKRRAYNG